MLVCDFRVEIGNEVVAPHFESDGGITVLFGASGAGKTVTLKAIAGLLRPAAGRILLDDRALFDAARNVNVPPGRRDVGYVPQSLALFPHMTVEENVGFGIAADSAERRRRVAGLIDQLGLGGLEKRKPPTLSGGQQQRVALARALARNARLLLLDEPFSALDESLRVSLRRELLRLRAELALTIVFVTHDLREAHLLADRLAVFDAGSQLQLGPREEVFRRPAARRVAELTGVANIFRAIVIGHEDGSAVVDADGVVLRCANGAEFGAGTAVYVAIRAERVNLLRRPVDEVETGNALQAAVVEEFAYGSTHTLHLAPAGPGPALEAELAARPYDVLGIATRRLWTVELPAKDLHVMPAS